MAAKPDIETLYNFLNGFNSFTISAYLSLLSGVIESVFRAFPKAALGINNSNQSIQNGRTKAVPRFYFRIGMEDVDYLDRCLGKSAFHNFHEPEKIMALLKIFL